MLKFNLIIVILFCIADTNYGQQETFTTSGAINFIDLFSTDDNSETSCYRIPAIMSTQDGHLIAAIDERNPSCGDLRSNDDINIVIRRSSDHGATWSAIESIVDYPIGTSASDPSMILDEETGVVFLFYNYMDLVTSPDQYYLKYISSIDNGKTWTAPMDITDQITPPSWGKDFKFITSGRGVQTSSGTLLHTIVNLEKGLHVYGSDDHGDSWYLIETPIIPGDESKIITLDDGTWMINSRVNNTTYRTVHTSHDEGLNWTTRTDTTLIDPACNASILRYTSISDGAKKNRILFSNANSATARENLTLRISYDEGKSWKYSKTIYKGKSAYSSLCILENGDIGIFFEKDDYKNNVFTKVSLEWLTNGEDSLNTK